jgi:hypothetical protein
MKKVIEFRRRAARVLSIIGLSVIAACPLVAHADTLQFFWDGPTSFTFDLPSQFIVQVPAGGDYEAGAVPCLFTGIATDCGVTFAQGGPFPFSGLVISPVINGNFPVANVIGSALGVATFSSSLGPAAELFSIPTGDYTVQMNQIFTSVSDVNPGILFVTDLSTPPVVAEPSTLALVLTGILGILGAVRTRPAAL